MTTELKITVLLLLLATGCQSKLLPDASVGVQNVAPFTDYRADESSASGYLFLSWPLPKGGLLHVQPIFTLDGKAQVVGIGADWTIPYKKLLR